VTLVSHNFIEDIVVKVVNIFQPTILVTIYTFINNLGTCWKIVTIIKNNRVISELDVYGGVGLLFPLQKM
jgi:hypothetical protein